MSQEIELTFEPKRTEEPAKPEPVQPTEELVLTQEEQEMVRQFAEKIDLADSGQILQYGAGAQKKIADFSQNALSEVRTKDLGEIGDLLSDMVSELRGFSADEEKKGFFGMFRGLGNKMEMLKTKYDKAEANVEKICEALEVHQVTLMKDIAMLDQMYEMNTTYFKELSMYIMAGKQRLQAAQNEELPRLLAKAKESGRTEDTQAANDFAALCNRFEKKVHDLDLTRTVSLQMAPQIRLIQNNDTMMLEKIQSTLVNTIPLWKNQMLIALGLSHSQAAAAAQREVSDITNEMLRKNAEALKSATVETAKESERGIVDIETLKQTNETLISTLDDVVRIQNEGREKRAQAEQELRGIESRLRERLLQIQS